MAGAGAGVVRAAWFPRAAQRPGAGAWVREVERALKKNGGCYEAKYAQLATIEKGEAGDDGIPAMLPRVRTIVFRSFLNAPTAPGAPSSKTETLEFITDRRSRKCNQLLEHSAAELSWYFPRTREQFRVAGQLKLVGADADEYGMGHMLEARLRRWKGGMSDNARAQFMWPEPAASREQLSDAAAQEEKDKTDFVPEPPLGPDSEPTDAFCLLLLEPSSVDHLVLKGFPQKRTLYKLGDDGEWSEQRVNP